MHAILPRLAVLIAACGSGRPAVRPAAPAPEAAPAPPEAGAPEPEEEFEVEGLLGKLDPAETQKIIDGHAAQLAACRDKVGLHYVGGQIELRLRVARDGTVRTAQITQGDLGAWPVEKCALAVARQMKFPRPRDGEAEVSFGVDLPGRGRIETASHERAEAELASWLRDLDACPARPAQVTITLYAAVAGAVTSVGFASPTEPLDETWADCAAACAIRWKLTDPRGKVAKISIVYGR